MGECQATVARRIGGNANHTDLSCAFARRLTDIRDGEGGELVRLYAKSLADDGTELERAILHGALKLALSEGSARVKVCGNCGWLFVDRTRNQNKRWCITALCGNRTKARRHYALKRQRLFQSTKHNAEAGAGL
jgi:predicted RNA-binding Zn ribbon-like protein